MPPSFDLLSGRSPAWRKIVGLAEELAPTPYPLLLLGPTGSGKTVIAGHIHDRSGRGPFIECALPAIPEELRQSTLAGHVRGSFTGAVTDQRGKLEEAHQGTLFLDEIGLASPTMQQYLLGILDNRPVARLGNSRSHNFDVRYIFATNREPEALVASGRWAEDFYYRLGLCFLRLPALKERVDDIVPLARAFLADELARLGRSFPVHFSIETELLFRQYQWPGNLRELRAVCERTAIGLTQEKYIVNNELPEEFLRRVHAQQPAALIENTLVRTGGNKSAAAREMGVSRQQLYRKLGRPARRSPGGGYPQV